MLVDDLWIFDDIYLALILAVMVSVFSSYRKSFTEYFSLRASLSLSLCNSSVSFGSTFLRNENISNCVSLG